MNAYLLLDLGGVFLLIAALLLRAEVVGRHVRRVVVQHLIEVAKGSSEKTAMRTGVRGGRVEKQREMASGV